MFIVHIYNSLWPAVRAFVLPPCLILNRIIIFKLSLVTTQQLELFLIHCITTRFVLSSHPVCTELKILSYLHLLSSNNSINSMMPGSLALKLVFRKAADHTHVSTSTFIPDPFAFYNHIQVHTLWSRTIR